MYAVGPSARLDQIQLSVDGKYHLWLVMMSQQSVANVAYNFSARNVYEPNADMLRIVA